MRPSRRDVLAGAGTGLAVGLAGCTSGGASFGAAEATLATAVQSDTGYSHHRTTEDTIVKEFGRFGITRSVEVTNVVAEYDRAIELGLLDTRLQAAVFAVLSTPQVRILGRSFNPVADMSTVEIADLLQERYEGISDVEEDGEFTAPVAGESTTVTRFTAEARLVAAGVALDVYLFVSAAVEVGEDFLVTLSVHPQAHGRKEDTVRRLMDGVVYE